MIKNIIRKRDFTKRIFTLAIFAIANAEETVQLPRAGWRSEFENYVPYLLQGTKDLTNQERVSPIFVSSIIVLKLISKVSKVDFCNVKVCRKMEHTC